MSTDCAALAHGVETSTLHLCLYKYYCTCVRGYFWSLVETCLSYMLALCEGSLEAPRRSVISGVCGWQRMGSRSRGRFSRSYRSRDMPQMVRPLSNKRLCLALVPRTHAITYTLHMPGAHALQPASLFRRRYPHAVGAVFT